jgi:hypothetical protein
MSAPKYQGSQSQSGLPGANRFRKRLSCYAGMLLNLQLVGECLKVIRYPVKGAFARKVDALGM